MSFGFVGKITSESCRMDDGQCQLRSPECNTACQEGHNDGLRLICGTLGNDLMGFGHCLHCINLGKKKRKNWFFDCTLNQDSKYYFLQIWDLELLFNSLCTDKMLYARHCAGDVCGIQECLVHRLCPHEQ